MTRQDHPELLKSILQLLTDEGSEAFAASLGILVNEAMRAERSVVLQAQPFERTEARTGYANGFKPKALTTRLGPITFTIRQVCGDLDFYPSALEKGVRSEQALNLALAESSGARQPPAPHRRAREEPLPEGQRCRSLTNVRPRRLHPQSRRRPRRTLRHFGFLPPRQPLRRTPRCPTGKLALPAPDGQRQILGTSGALSEAEVHWRDFPPGPSKAWPLRPPVLRLRCNGFLDQHLVSGWS